VHFFFLIFNHTNYKLSTKKEISSVPLALASIVVSPNGTVGKQWRKAEKRTVSVGPQVVLQLQSQSCSEVPKEDRLVAVDVRYELVFSKGNNVLVEAAEQAEQPHRSL
jgi:hypothetical protein